MLQDNPLLAQLKQQFHAQIPRAEGIVKSHEKGYGFLETDNKKSYFISATKMKKVIDGDKVSGILVQNGDKTAFEPETLLEPALNVFLGQVHFNNGVIGVIPEHVTKLLIKCKVGNDIQQSLQEGDWVKVQLISHPLKDNDDFFAEIIQFITKDESVDLMWLLALARYNLDFCAPVGINPPQLQEDKNLTRLDLTNRYFFTVDNKDTRDMDDALSIIKNEQGNYKVTIAIADPSSYINENSELDNIAYQRSFSTYLSGFTVPMLPTSLANELCSLEENQQRSALVCEVVVTSDGDIIYDSVQFHLAWVVSKAKLTYDDVSNFIDNNIPLATDNDRLLEQLTWLAELATIRTNWRNKNALLFKNNHEYRFVFDCDKQLIAINKEVKQTAHKMIEEAMIIANQVFTHQVKTQLGFGIFNIHLGFDSKYIDSALKLLRENQIDGFDKEKLSSFDGYRDLRHIVENNEFLEYRLRRFQASTDFSIEPDAHFALGFDAYATWTSPIRKYGDLFNHRLIKAILAKTTHSRPDKALLSIMNERRKAVRLAEREVNSKLYCQFLAEKIGQQFEAQIINLNRGGIKARLIDNGAIVFVPASLVHSVRNELELLPEDGKIKIKGELKYQLLDTISVTINEIKPESLTVIAKLTGQSK
ncbi:exoribonuclease II [Orbus sturtevantii]|uniref:exoribonuclease II n=1 Tax=Orbus sturtevantii TaxID=3074109 RepID=UPI00370D004C